MFFIPEPITFADKSRVLYAPIGGNVTLPCEVSSSPPSYIVWTHDEAAVEGEIDIVFLSRKMHMWWLIINAYVLGNGFRKVADGLAVLNVTEEKLGNYTCTAYQPTADTTFTKHIDLTLKLASNFFLRV